MGQESTPNEKLLKQLFSAFNEQDWGTYGDLMTDDVVIHESGKVMRGTEEIIEHDKEVQEELPGATITAVDIVTSGDQIAAREEISAENQEASSIFYAKIKDAKFSEIWVGRVD